MAGDKLSDVAIAIAEIEGVGIPIGEIVYFRYSPRHLRSQPVPRRLKLILRNVEGVMINRIRQHRIGLFKCQVGVAGAKGDTLRVIFDQRQMKQVVIKTTLPADVAALKHNFQDTHEQTSPNDLVIRHSSRVAGQRSEKRASVILPECRQYPAFDYRL